MPMSEGNQEARKHGGFSDYIHVDTVKKILDQDGTLSPTEIDVKIWRWRVREILKQHEKGTLEDEEVFERLLEGAQCQLTRLLRAKDSTDSGDEGLPVMLPQSLFSEEETGDEETDSK